MAAVSVTDMLAAHIFESSGQTVVTQDDTAFRKQLAKENRDVELLFDVAKAHKHVRLIYGTPRVSDAAATSVGSIGYGMGNYGEDVYDGPRIIVVEKSGEIHDLLPLVGAALQFLAAKV